ncbi:MAG: DUF1992 domain-containing protein [Acidobacteria bacterium]|nr:DUF1992 domain-containing protein [Acidobacteriota bacterium]
MSLQKFIEEKIKQAIADGEFDNLEGAGKPLDLNTYFNALEDMRMGYSLLKSNNFVPEEVELLREIGQLKEKLKTCDDISEKKDLTKNLHDKTLTFNILMERNKQRK